MADEIKNQTEIVNKHAENALKVVANAAAEASRVIACAAAEAVKVRNAEDKNDHDILLTFRAEAQTEFKAIRSDIKNIGDGTTGRISKLETEKNDIKDSYLKLYKDGVENSLSDHDKRLKKTETSISWIWGGIAILGFLFVIIAALISYIFISNSNNTKDQIQDIKLLFQNHITQNK